MLTAHQILVRLNRGTDLGPAAKANAEERELAVKRWREWWGNESNR